MIRRRISSSLKCARRKTGPKVCQSTLPLAGHYRKKDYLDRSRFRDLRSGGGNQISPTMIRWSLTPYCRFCVKFSNQNDTIIRIRIQQRSQRSKDKINVLDGGTVTSHHENPRTESFATDSHHVRLPHDRTKGQTVVNPESCSKATT